MLRSSTTADNFHERVMDPPQAGTSQPGYPRDDFGEMRDEIACYDPARSAFD
jgi:hypothetical protein